MPARIASWFVASVIGWPSSRISPASGRVMPNRVSASSVRPAPEQAGQAQHLAATQGEADVLVLARRG